MLTLATARRALWKYGSNVPYATATVVDIGEFDAALNETVERFFTLGTWRNMWKRVVLTVFNDRLTIPRGFDTCRQVENCAGETSLIYSQFHQAASNYATSVAVDTGLDISYFGGLGSLTTGMRLVDENAQTFVIPTGTFTLRTVGTEISAAGLTLIGGYGADGVELFGSATLAVANGATNGAQQYTQLPLIQKAVTANAVSLYAVDTTTAVATLIGNYAPGETVPSYRQYSLGSSDLDGDTVTTICKLGFVPAVTGTDLIVPGNLGALKLGLMSRAYEDKTDPENAARYMGPSFPDKTGKMAGAIDLLDAELAELEASEIPAFRVNPSFGAGNIRNVR